MGEKRKAMMLVDETNTRASKKSTSVSNGSSQFVIPSRIGKGKWNYSLNPDMKDRIEQEENPFGIISIFGKYRSGKSSLLNLVVLRDYAHTFRISSSIQAETIGMNIGNMMVSCKDGSNAFVIDVQGSCSLDDAADETHDLNLAAIAYLISTTIINNVKSTIDESTIENLELMARAAEQIRYSASSSSSSSITNQVDNNNNDGTLKLMSQHAPTLLMVVRDMSLELKDVDGRMMTEDEYLEIRGLAAVTGDSEQCRAKNRKRDAIKTLFPKRHCKTLPVPLSDSDKLKDLIHLPRNQFKPEFNSKADALHHFILNTTHAKKINNHFITGKAFIHYVEEILHAINTGTNIQLFDTFTAITRLQQQEAFQSCLNGFENKLKQFDNDHIRNHQKINIIEYEGKLNAMKDEALLYFTSLTSNDDQGIDKLNTSMNVSIQSLLKVIQLINNKYMESLLNYLLNWNNKGGIIIEGNLVSIFKTEYDKIFMTFRIETTGVATIPSNPLALVGEANWNQYVLNHMIWNWMNKIESTLQHEYQNQSNKTRDELGILQKYVDEIKVKQEQEHLTIELEKNSLTQRVEELSYQVNTFDQTYESLRECKLLVAQSERSYIEIKEQYDQLLLVSKLKDEENEEINNKSLMEMQMLQQTFDQVTRKKQQQVEEQEMELNKFKTTYTQLEQNHHELQDKFMNTSKTLEQQQETLKLTVANYKKLKDENKLHDQETNELNRKLTQYEKELNIKMIQLESKEKALNEKQAECQRLNHLGELTHKLKLDVSLLEAENKYNKDTLITNKMTVETLRQQLETCTKQNKSLERQVMIGSLQLQMQQQPKQA